MEDINLLKKLLIQYKSTSEFESRQAISYSIFTIIILSYELVDSNEKLEPFLHALDIKLKPYAFKNRTLVLGLTLRILKSVDNKTLNTIIDKIYPLFFNKKSEINYFDDLLKFFWFRGSSEVY